MKVEMLMKLLADGKHPVVRLSNALWDDSWGVKGMIAEVTGADGPDSDGCVTFSFDYNKFLDANLPLQHRDYYLKNGQTGTAFESGLMKEGHVEEEVCFMEAEDVPVDLVDGKSLVAEYQAVGVKQSYVEWLEEKLEKLVPEELKTWKKA